MKTNEKICNGCKFHIVRCRIYRDECTKDGVGFIIPDAVINWIKLFGCASWRKADD